MKKKVLKDKTLEKLTSDLATLKFTISALSGILIVLFIVTIYGFFSEKFDEITFTLFIIVAISCSAVIPINLGEMKQIKKELSLRKSM